MISNPIISAKPQGYGVQAPTNYRTALLYQDMSFRGTISFHFSQWVRTLTRINCFAARAGVAPVEWTGKDSERFQTGRHCIKHLRTQE